MFSKNTSSNTLNKEINKKFDIMNKNDLQIKLLDYFSNKKIYCEIFNGSDNVSESFSTKLKAYNAIIYKKLTKSIDYIVFKDGHLKTKKYASLKYSEYIL